MSDLVNQLNAMANAMHDDLSIAADAAAKIEAQEAEIKDLREALKNAIEWDGHDDEGVPAVWLDDARAALGEQS